LLAYAGIGFFVLLLIKSISTEYENVRSFHWYFYFCTIYSIFLTLAPFNWITPLTLLLYFIIVLFPTFAVPYMTVKMIRRKQQDAIYILLAATSVTSSVIWGVIKNTGWVPTPFYPLDIIAAVVGFSAYWFKQYFRNSEQTSRLAAQLQHTDKLKDEFLANTAHELRTPLHGIINIAHTLRHDTTAFGSRNRQDLELIITIGQRMSYLLNDLLDLNRLQEKRITLNAKPVAVQALASGVLDILRMMTDGKPITLVMNIPDHFPDIHADEQRIIQILFNLVHNAIKFTNEGSIVIQGFVQGATAYIEVKDTGVGMDEETQQRVFKAYEQGPLQAVGGGIGLGLSICKQLVELHGGTLYVESAPGEGAVFTFTLPLAEKRQEISAQLEDPTQLQDLAYERENSAATNLIDQASNIVQTYWETAATDSSVCERAKILAVDDDPVNLKILVKLLPAEKYEITTALSGKEALELLGTKRWDLIIADVMMPQMSGYEFTRQVRQRHTISELPVLLLTARSQSEDVYSGFLSGANDYVTKPVDAMELNYRVQALTTLGHSIRQRLRMEAAYLQAQIKPHFLFNTLNSITALGDIDIEQMRRLIEAFSSYLRISFDFWNTEQLVPLVHELELVRSYLYIEKERFQERLNYELEVQSDLYLRIPPLTIQPLVENALRHGILSRISGGTVKIRIQDHEDYTAFLISDNGVGMNEEKVSSLLERTSGDTRKGIGLVNTNRRLLQWCGKGLTITSTPGVGTSISFAIPKSEAPH